MERLENIYPVVKRLLGMVVPIGESSVDEVRLLNLKDQINISDSLVDEIIHVRDLYCNGEHSIKLAKKEADEFLKSLYLSLKEDYENK